MELKRVLTQQKYPTKVINDAVSGARDLNCTDLINKLKELTIENKQSNLIVTYASKLPNINNILHKHYNILSQSKLLKEIFPAANRIVY